MQRSDRALGRQNGTSQMVEFSIIRPLCDNEQFLAQTLGSSFTLDLPCTDYEVIFCAEPDSPAVECARMLCVTHPHISSHLVITSPTRHLDNPKLQNLQKAWRHARGKWLILADSNVMLSHDTTQRLRAVWTDDTGMVCSPPLGTQPENFWAMVECAFLNTFQGKWQLLANAIGHGYAQGKIMMVNKDQFEHWGGLPALDQEACEDAAATKLVRAHGHKVRLTKELFEQPLGTRSFRAIWNRQLRWARLRRSTFPLEYGAELLVTPLPSLPMFWLFPIPSLCLWLVGYIIELTIAYYRGWPTSWRLLLALPVRDLLLIALWCAGWFGHSIEWGGKKLALET